MDNSIYLWVGFNVFDIGCTDDAFPEQDDSRFYTVLDFAPHQHTY